MWSPATSGSASAGISSLLPQAYGDPACLPLTPGISSAQTHRELGVKLSGIGEADIGIIKIDGGQSPRAGHMAPRTNVLGLVSRDGEALQMQVPQSLDTHEIVRACRDNVGTVCSIYTDVARSFN